MLELTFTPSDKQVSEAETKKRLRLLNWFSQCIDKAVAGMLVSGSMAYGYDYSVKKTSDIDMQLIVTPETVGYLKRLDVFNPQELEGAISGYLKGVYSQFSLVFKKDDVSMECHFWDQAAFIAAITYRAHETKRLRSTIDTPSTDHGFSFARDESVKDYYGEIADGYAISVFPSYRKENNTLYLCRPITNILGLPRIEKTTPQLDAAIAKTWKETVNRLIACAENGKIDLAKYNIANALPGKNKMRQDVLDRIQQRTIDELKTNGITLTISFSCNSAIMPK